MNPHQPFHREASLADLAALHEYVHARCQLLRIDDATAYDIDLAVTELVTNSIVHGYRGKPGWVEVDFEWGEKGIDLWVRDRAPVFDPNTVAAPDLSLPLEKRGFGGMGIHLIRQMVPAIQHRPLAGGGNEIQLTFPQP